MIIMRQLIRTDGHISDLPRALTVAQIQELIGTKGFGLDTVALRHMGEPLHVMLVDDVGRLKGLPVNEEATRLYHRNCRPGSCPPPIVGDVVVVPDADFHEPRSDD